MSNNNPTPEAEPLHTATLLAVLAKLRDRLAAIPALVDDDTADHPLTHVELAGWEARVEALEGFAADVALMLKGVNPRARVVVLPEPDAPNGKSGKLWRTSPGIRVCTGPDGENLVSFGGALMVADDAAQLARAILAAAEFAGGAQ